MVGALGPVSGRRTRSRTVVTSRMRISRARPTKTTTSTPASVTSRVAAVRCEMSSPVPGRAWPSSHATVVEMPAGDQQAHQEAQRRRRLEPTEATREHAVGDRRADRVRRAVGDHQRRRRARGGRALDEGDRDHDVGRGDAALDEEDRAVELEGVEPPQHQVVDGEEDDAGTEQDHRHDVVVEGLAGRAVPEEHLGAVEGQQGQGQRERAPPSPAPSAGCRPGCRPGRRGRGWRPSPRAAAGSRSPARP